ncbi:winged helix-turn-helix transcriptional regulator [Sphingobacterium spiritivorum]|uniref:winged helix-turn-helix transcriptional regulator n=1 Tax=Sphingobacterium spiritivorum TaxID=258 RepID=UPI003DA46B9F
MSNMAINDKVRETTCSEELMAIRDSLDILGGKWKLMILRYLSNRQGQDIHFKKMQREISGISAKMLSKELKDLERNLLITRSVQDQHLIMVYYAVTEYGKSVLPLTENLVEWGLYHRQKIKAEMK